MTPADYERLSGFIYDVCGISLGDQKKTMLETRLQKRLRTLGIRSFGDYCDLVTDAARGETERIPLIDLVTTNKTDFFREPNHYEYLTGHALPEAVRSGWGISRPLSVWSAGCSTGEEPYTLAMVLSEYAESVPGFAFGILATDISTRVLKAAHRAIYDAERIGPVPLPLRRKYLLRSRDPKAGLVRIAPEIREKVRFRHLNFLESDFGMREPVDVVFCRNVIIYFDKATQERILTRIAGHMTPGGYLFMGHSETLFGLRVPVRQVAPTIYRRMP
jgi:chemotaxis protein methyltransferase CheR